MMTGDGLIEVWILGMTLVILAGLNAPLGALALVMASASATLALRAELAWLASPGVIWLWSALLIVQFLADLYFMPATVRDHPYVHRERTANAYLHARLQSLVRPLIAALVLAALPLPLGVQAAAVVGFVMGTAVYWGTAWVREQLAISRGSVILLITEMAKNAVALGAAVLATSSAPLALACLVYIMLVLALWAGRLRREQTLYLRYGGRIASEDS